MGGVDLSDQNMKYYCVMRKSHKWWKKLFFFFFNMILTNSYALYRKYGANKKLKSQDFREQIASALIMEAPEAPKPKPAKKQPLTNSSPGGTFLHIIYRRKVLNANIQCVIVLRVMSVSRTGDLLLLSIKETQQLSIALTVM